MTIAILATAIRLLNIFIEYPYLRRYRALPAKNWDKHSARLWDACNLLEPVGFVLGFAGIGRMDFQAEVTGLLGITLLITGISIRWMAIRALGSYFTGTVMIKTDHRLVRAGIYRHLRHPAYAGTLLLHLGLGLSFANWFSLAFSTLPFLLAALYRMHVEEQALTEAFGTEYVEYSRSSKRLIPRLY